MDILLIILGFSCVVLGLLGSVLPVLPGPILSWTGLLLLYLTNAIQTNYLVLSITFIITMLITILDFIIPAQGTKRFGGTKYGIWGTNIGLVSGLFFPPFGFIIGPFLGAFLGEIIYNSKDKKGALKSAVGSFIGFLVSSFMKFIVCLSFIFLFTYVFVTNYIF